jgi:hypothetical protein
MFSLVLKDIKEIQIKQKSYFQFDTELYDGDNHIKISTTDTLKLKVLDFDFELFEVTGTRKDEGFTQRFALSNADTSMNKGKYTGSFYYTRNNKEFHVKDIDIFIQ